MTRFAYGVAAALMMSLVAGSALADELKDSCVKGQKGDPGAEKNCTCLVSKIKPGDIPAATKAANAMDAAEASGKPMDEANPPPDIAAGLKIIFDAMAQCT